MEVDLDEEWVVPPAMPHSKCGWTPFVGMRLRGRVRRVVLRGQVAYVDGVVTAAPGAGQNIRYMPLSASQPAQPAQALLSSPVVSSVADHAQLDAVPPASHAQVRRARGRPVGGTASLIPLSSFIHVIASSFRAQLMSTLHKSISITFIHRACTVAVGLPQSRARALRT